ncbi:double-stranded RNA-binding protein 4-like [Rhododendron vialii]|uniref:double-stranded RNA-binding protein 4-like n=1 Tax=Rhododendron vialii TaxID=182163 RepID=UPI00265E0E0F|nr:double-stranded RNA-binding protein 4-like [Rhododendron vialii]
MRLTVFVIQIDCLSDSFLVDDKNLCLVCLDLPDHLMHKNQLQEHTQKLGLPAPVYQSTNEGFPHAPKFRSAVLVDGKEYVSKQMYSHKKEAEQEVAKYAFDCIMRRIKDERCKLIHQDTVFCKSILLEFATKMNLTPPIYTTPPSENPQPVFVSSLVFDGKTYTGEVAKSKKVAEQLAARSAIQSLLGSDAKTVVSDMIKAKRKLHDSLDRDGSSSQQRTANTLRDPAVGFNSEGKTNLPSCLAKRRLELIKHGEQKRVRIIRN